MTIQHLTDAGWGNEDWGLVSTAVRETIHTTARVRSVLPRGPSAPLAYNVDVPTVNVPPGGGTPRPALTLNTTGTQRPIRISRNFDIQVDQLHDRDGIVRVARRAAHLVAAAEDMILLFGGRAIASPIVLQVDASAAYVAGTPGIWTNTANVIPTAGADPTDAVQLGIEVLEGKGYYGPYAVLMTRPLWSQTAATPSDREQKQVIAEILGPNGALEPVPAPGALTGAPFNAVDGTAMSKIGVVFARAPHAFDFVEIEPPSVGFVEHVSAQDSIRLRVEERFVLRVIEANASCLIGIV